MITDDTQQKLDGIEKMARHAGACEAMLRACRLLQAYGHRAAADKLVENLERIVEPTGDEK